MQHTVLACLCCLSLAVDFDPADVLPGKKGWGYVSVLDNLAAKVDMPIMVVRGHAGGPTLAVTAGLYPLEYCGIEAAGRLYARLDPGDISGTVIIVPVVNMPVLQFRTPMFALTRSLSPMDGQDINAVFPGDPNGTVSQVIAFRLLQDVILKSQYHVDLRGGEISESHLMHTIFLDHFGNLTDEARTMASAFGLNYLIFEPEYAKPGPLIYEAMSHGIPSIVSESGLGFNKQPGEKQVNGHVDGVLNLLVHLRMMQGSIKKPAQQNYLLPRRVELLSPATGIFKHIPDQGDVVKAGQVIGHICDLDSSILATIHAPPDHEWIVHEMMPQRLVYKGDRVYHLAVIGPPVMPPLTAGATPDAVV